MSWAVLAAKSGQERADGDPVLFFATIFERRKKTLKNHCKKQVRNVGDDLVLFFAMILNTCVKSVLVRVGSQEGPGTD